MLAACLEGGCRTNPGWPLWESYTKNAFDEQGRIVDHSAGDRTTSEGQAYGMFFALVANDRARFDKLLSWTQDNLASGDLMQRLPAWSWGQGSGWKLEGAGSESGFGCRSVDDLRAAGGGTAMARYALSKAGHGDGNTYYSAGGGIGAGLRRYAAARAARVSSGCRDVDLNPSYLQPSVLSYLATTFRRAHGELC